MGEPGREGACALEKKEDAGEEARAARVGEAGPAQVAVRLGGRAGGLRARERVHWGPRAGEPGALGASARPRSSPLRKAAPPGRAVGSSRRELIFGLAGSGCSLPSALLPRAPYGSRLLSARRHALLGRRRRRLRQQAGSGRGRRLSALRAALGARHGSHPRVGARRGLRPVQVRATAGLHGCKHPSFAAAVAPPRSRRNKRLTVHLKQTQQGFGRKETKRLTCPKQYCAACSPPFPRGKVR